MLGIDMCVCLLFLSFSASSMECWAVLFLPRFDGSNEAGVGTLCQVVPALYCPLYRELWNVKHRTHASLGSQTRCTLHLFTLRGGKASMCGRDVNNSVGSVSQLLLHSIAEQHAVWLNIHASLDDIVK